MALDLAGMVIIPGVVIGIIAGIVDLVFMIKDESGSAKVVLGHGLGAFIPLIVLSIISMNISIITSLPAITGTFLSNEVGMRALFILFIVVYIHGKSAVFKGVRGAGMRETWWHSAIVALIVGLAPVIYPLIAPQLPEWAQ